jgi:hypothetical protein
MKGVTAIAVGVAAALSALLAGVGGAHDATAAFPCPSDPKTQPLGKIYGKSRGTTFCNDGAKAVALVGKTRVILAGGVCWRNRTSLQVGIGTVVINDPKKSDPAGMTLADAKPGDIVGDTVGLSKGTLDWTGPVKVKLTGKTKGTFAATPVAVRVNGKLSGSFTCKRILDAPDQ